MSPTVRQLPRPRRLVALGFTMVALLLLLMAGVGMGAGTMTGDVTISGNLESVLTITDPTSLNAGSSTDASLMTGVTDIINLGQLNTAPQIQQARATWRVSTNDPDGYSVSIRATGATEPVMQNTGSGADFPDLCTVGQNSCPRPCTLTSCSANQTGLGRGFGIAVGDPDQHNQEAVASIWGTQGATGTQGTWFGAIPVSGTGVLLGQRSAPIWNDPITITFMARQSLDVNGIQDAGTFQGDIRLTAITL
jgi:hypothetical protein